MAQTLWRNANHLTTREEKPLLNMIEPVGFCWKLAVSERWTDTNLTSKMHTLLKRPAQVVCKGTG